MEHGGSDTTPIACGLFWGTKVELLVVSWSQGAGRTPADPETVAFHGHYPLDLLTITLNYNFPTLESPISFFLVLHFKRDRTPPGNPQ